MGIRRAVGILAAAALVTLAGCSSSGSDGGDNASGDSNTIVIGASSTPHAEILEFVQEQLAEDAGFTLDVKIYDDYVLPNEALAAGDLDANYFQHLPYLEEQIAQKGFDFYHFEGVHYEPFAIYSKKITDIEKLAKNAKVGVTNDPSNQARALNLLQEAGIITLKDTGDSDPTILDIDKNPQNVDVVEMAPEQLARSLDDLDIAAINGNFAIQAGLEPTKDGIYIEKAEGNVYSNILVVRTEDKDKKAIVALDQALHSPEVKVFIEETWPDGSVAPSF